MWSRISWYDEPDEELSDDSERRCRDAAMLEWCWPLGRRVDGENVSQVPDRWQRWICSGVLMIEGRTSVSIS